jgi:TonB family protein
VSTIGVRHDRFVGITTRQVTEELLVQRHPLESFAGLGPCWTLAKPIATTVRLEALSSRMVVSPRGYRLETAEGKIMRTKLILATLLLACTAAASTSEPETPMCLCKFVAPRYSPIARQAVIQGKVHVHVDVGSNGVPGDIDILDQANQILGESAVNALKNWRFCSPSGNNEPHKMTVTFIFKLEGEATQSWAPTNVSFEQPATVIVSTPSGATVQSDVSGSSD